MPLSFATAFDRVRRLLASTDVRELRDPEAGHRADRGIHSGHRIRARGHARTRRAAHAGDLRQARPARWPVLRGDDLRHAVATSTPGAQRQIEDAVAAAARRSACITVRFTPNAASTAAACSSSKWRRGRSAACARRRCASSTPACVDWFRGVPAAARARRADGRAGAREPRGVSGDDDSDSPQRRLPARRWR